MAYRATRPFRYGGRFYAKGEIVDVSPAQAGKLCGYGLVTGRGSIVVHRTRETAATSPPERAAVPDPMPREVGVDRYHQGAGWYQLPGGRKVRGRDAAQEALEEEG